MLQLVAGLVLFFGTHSVSIVAPSWRDRMAERGKIVWKLGYGLLSLAGIVLVVRGYGELRLTSEVLYVPPIWMRHLAALLLLPVFVLFLAPYFPGKIKTKLKHPQLTSVKLWATVHLLVNGRVVDVILFGAFLAWAVADRISLKRRPARPVPAAPASPVNDVILVVLGLGIYAWMVMRLHAQLFGVAPLPMGA